MTQQTPPSAGYEKRDVNVRNLILIAVLCVVIIVVAVAWVRVYFIKISEEEIYQSVLKPGSITLQELRAKEDNVLNTYRIIDPSKGIYQIPIDRAMELLADEAGRAPSVR